ncbi:hypothetical protein IW262DRAFT_1297699 [Armillaria fumosa]|nr:hypothetical protein IW262DRAFT_1297699 [Armillaria fumosa]
MTWNVALPKIAGNVMQVMTPLVNSSYLGNHTVKHDKLVWADTIQCHFMLRASNRKGILGQVISTSMAAALSTHPKEAVWNTVLNLSSYSDWNPLLPNTQLVAKKKLAIPLGNQTAFPVNIFTLPKYLQLPHDLKI